MVKLESKSNSIIIKIDINKYESYLEQNDNEIKYVLFN